MSFSYIWPLGLVVLSNVAYNVCAKSVSSAINPLASLSITYIIGAVFATVLYFATTSEPNLLHEYTKVNWASFALGFAIVGLEVGYILAYKAGWPISTAATVQSAALAVILLAVGIIFYHEGISMNRILGIAICLVGLYFINK